MKSMVEIRALPRMIITQESADGFQASVSLLSSPKNKNRPATVLASWGCWWEHVSVSFLTRMPTWDEMAEIKRMFFRPEEVCVEYHPAEDEYVNLFPFCLHIWRPTREVLPFPPSWMVGPRKGESMIDVRRIADAEMDKWEEEVYGKQRV